ncbi:exonuclease SbcCD subunit D [Bacillus sp. FJAT-42376]|uniref:exonuclease SbcCD subunit D n=1 Tax=Bacillus sp. FJAT-42376 TaxID=2014076 RepID=UPI000F517025|nr:exonuclease SbcCD subunit D [Bacillus sp. FJAT-42376]AZB42277.1 exonuclease SbcCD subunit D [Bacillus sp. FJAT-42376]
MRILHTADWHLGKTLEGRSRLPEQAAFLDELAGIVESEKIDAVIMAGDVFDTVNPPSAAEKLFYESMSRLSDKGRRPIVVIAGNHDNPERLSAASPLAGDHHIHLIGYPSDHLLKVDVPLAGQTMNIAALAYPSESRLEQVLSENFDELLMRNHYDAKIKALFESMAKGFGKDTVNLAMSHLHVAGGSTSDSERPIEVGGAYTVAADSLPAAAQYVALGHLHRPQTIKRALTEARYSGSPLAYSFSEAGYAKSVTIVEADPGEAAKVQEVFLSSGKPLVQWKAAGGIAQVHDWLEQGKDANAWVDLEIQLSDALSMEEIQNLRKRHSGIVHIRPVFHSADEALQPEARSSVPIDELFARFYEKQTGGAKPDDRLIRLFRELVSEEDSGEGEGA